MRYFSILLLFFSLAILSGCASGPLPPIDLSDDYTPAPRPVRLSKGTRVFGLVDRSCSANKKEGLAHQIQSRSKCTQHLKVQAYSWTLEDEQSLEQLTSQAKSDTCVLHLAPDVRVQALGTPNDPRFADQWSLPALQAPAAWDHFYGENGIKSDIVIAILDTGVDAQHPDLSSNMLKNADGTFGYDFVNSDADPADDNGHGTHVAGIAAAVSNNAVGVAGVMGSHAKIMSVKVLDSEGAGYTSDIINGINYAVEHGAHVINLSLGSPGRNDAMENALKAAVAAGVTIAAAAGNDGERLSSETFQSPASYASQLDGIISVGSIDSNLRKSRFSDYSPEYVEIAAPGRSILSTYNDHTYTILSGTSMSTPIVAGAAGLAIGLLKSRGLAVTPALVESLLKSSAISEPGLRPFFQDGHRLDLLRLAQRIQALK